MTKPQTSLGNLHKTTPEEARSWAIHWTAEGKPEIIPSSWQVGYTEAFKSTPEAAIGHQMQKLSIQMVELTEMYDDLKVLLEEERRKYQEKVAEDVADCA